MARNSRILGIVVTYLPAKGGLTDLIKALAPQVDTILIVDNSPPTEDEITALLATVAHTTAGLRLIRAGRNLGIAAAQNIGIEVALREGFDYVLLSDQDSVPEVTMVSTLLKCCQELQDSGQPVGCISPEYYDETTGQVFPFQVMRRGRFLYGSATGAETRPWIEVLTTISSGSLVPCDTLRAVGGMREDFFIDHVDTEWTHRARSLGFRCYGTSLTRLRHRLGDGAVRFWYFGWHTYSRYSPLRLYYRFRNFVLLCRLPHVSLRWKIRASWYWLGNLYVHALFGERKQANLRAIATGLADGAFGRSGEAPAKLRG